MLDVWCMVWCILKLSGHEPWSKVYQRFLFFAVLKVWHRWNYEMSQFLRWRVFPEVLFRLHMMPVRVILDSFKHVCCHLTLPIPFGSVFVSTRQTLPIPERPGAEPKATHWKSLFFCMLTCHVWNHWPHEPGTKIARKMKPPSVSVDNSCASPDSLQCARTLGRWGNRGDGTPLEDTLWHLLNTVFRFPSDPNFLWPR